MNRYAGLEEAGAIGICLSPALRTRGLPAHTSEQVTRQKGETQNGKEREDV